MSWFSRKKEQAPEKSVFKKMSAGLSRSADKISTGITDIFTKKKLDAQTLKDLEELLITADLGPALAAKIVARLAQSRFEQEVTPEEIKEALADEIEKILLQAEKPLDVQRAKPFVILMVGVNGTGKTTTAGKLAHHFVQEGKKVMLAAGDTFRAAAVEQLKTWGARAQVPVMTKEEGADPAALAFEAVSAAQGDGMDILMIDTAGRLQNKADLMAELQKIARVVGKKMEEAPHAVVLVLDATVGQNALSQVEQFKNIVNITGLIVTKLDGTARGGVLISLVERFGLPVHAIGIGEGIEDLRPFQAREFARSLTGLETQ